VFSRNPNEILAKLRKARIDTRIGLELHVLLSASRVRFSSSGSDTPPLLTLKRNGMKFSFLYAHEFKRIYRDIFATHMYSFESDTPSPLIIDCGAHLGIAVLYFKTLYPRSRIVAVEANPETFKLLRRNVAQNDLEGVRLVNAAVAASEGQINFYVPSGDKRYSWGDTAIADLWGSKRRRIQVPALLLSRFLEESVALLKLDIEGLEGLVLREARGNLHNVRNLILEFHGRPGDAGNRLDDVVSLLETSGFRYRMRQHGHEVSRPQIDETKRFFLMIYAHREGTPVPRAALA
jgi:FkbM family methyltransferase